MSSRRIPDFLSGTLVLVNINRTVKEFLYTFLLTFMNVFLFTPKPLYFITFS